MTKCMGYSNEEVQWYVDSAPLVPGEGMVDV
jgi:hypothetical protein